MESKEWKLVRLFNEKYLRIPPVLSDYIAVKDILRLSVSGLSNMTIMRQLDEGKEYVEQVLHHFLEFEGFDKDLDFNPYIFYSRNNKNFTLFKDEISRISGVSDDFYFLLNLFRICIIFDEIDKKIMDYYKKEQETND
jgi:hypothetical protein